MVTLEVPSVLARRSGGNTGLSSLLGQHGTPHPNLGYVVTVEDEQGRWVQTAGLVPTTGQGTGAVSPRYRSAQACGGFLPCPTHG